ncbi:hypothetical protein IJT17_08530 [bacterium]|nr:hypothetical protein [bacterium]
MSINPLHSGIAGSYAPTEATAKAAPPQHSAQQAPSAPESASDRVTLTASSSDDKPKAAAQPRPENKPAASPKAADTPSASGAGQAKAPAANTAANPSVPASVQTGSGEEWHVAGASSQAAPANVSKDAKELADTMPSPDRQNPIFATATDGNDEIYITAGENNGLIITINGQETKYDASVLSRLVIDGGKGDDRITVDEKVTQSLRLTGGEGNDYIIGGSGGDIIFDNYGSNTINGAAGNDVIIAHGVDLKDGQGNRLEGGAGDDYLEGGNGKDYMSGGDGYDVIYGLGGDDEIHGGAGNDYLDGGEGNDTIYGDEGNDNLIGGKGDDVLRGGAGDDLLIGASGSDSINGEGGNNRIISSGDMDTINAGAGDSVQTITTVPMTRYVSPWGKDDYEETRVRSDLETLANTENGQLYSQTMFDTGHNTDIRMTVGGSSCRSDDGCDVPGVGSDSTIYYAFSKIALTGDVPWANRAPIVSLFHEMCHSYNAALGNMDRNFYDYDGNKVRSQDGLRGVEFQAVGIPNPSVTPNPTLMTENSLRELFGYERRERY